MRKASIITLIVAVCLMVAGGVCCAVGAASAKSENVMLFPEVKDGESIYTYDLTEREINRVSVSAKKAKLTLHRGGERSYLTIKNYNANFYRLNEENKGLTFSEIEDVLSMFKFWEGMTFKGMRYFFSSGIDNADRHEIEINLAENDDLRTFTLTLESGSIDLTDFVTEGDITVRITDGDVIADKSTVGGTLNITAEKGSVTVIETNASTIAVGSNEASVIASDLKCNAFKWEGAKKGLSAERVDCAEFTAKSGDGSVKVDELMSVNTVITSTAGSVELSLPGPMGSYSTEIASKSGNIFVDGTQYKMSCALTSETAKNSIRIDTDSALVDIKSTPSEEESAVN